MPGIDFNQLLTMARLRPNKQPDGRNAVPGARGGSFGEQYVMSVHPDFGVACDEGSLFTVNNGQTGIATAAAPTSFSATNPFVLIYNKAPQGPQSPRIVLDYCTLLATAAGTAGASLQCAVTLDATNRYSSGGTALTSAIVNPNPDSQIASQAVIYAGNLTATAATPQAMTVVGNRYLKGAIPVAGDTYTLKFGGVDAPSFFGISTILFATQNVGKIEIPPGWSCLIHLWLPSQSAASSYAPELTWLER